MKKLVLFLLAVGMPSFFSFAHMDETDSKTGSKKDEEASVPAPTEALPKVDETKSTRQVKKRRDMSGLFKPRDGRKVKEPARNRLSHQDRELELEQSLEDPKKRAELEEDFMKAFRIVVRGTISTSGKDMLEIDLGKENGVKVGATVMTIEGLLGVVSKIEGDSCKVMLITHPDSRVSVRLPGTLDRAYLCGDGDGKVKLIDSMIGKKQRPISGAALLTSGRDHVTKKAIAVPSNLATVKIVDDPKSKSDWGIEVIAPIAKLKSVIVFSSGE